MVHSLHINRINNVCHCDGKHSEYQVNFFSSYNACCEFAWFGVYTDDCKQARSTQEAKCIKNSNFVRSSFRANDDAEAPSPASPIISSATTIQSPTINTLFYPDRVNSICLNDDNNAGDQQPIDHHEMWYTNIEECCNDPWVDYTTCITHAATDGKPYYPDYVYKMCRNDGNHSPQAHLFYNREECCNVQYMDHEACMSNAGS